MALRRLCLLAFVLTSVLAAAPEVLAKPEPAPAVLAQAQPKPAEMAEARERYKKGLELYEEGAFDAARTELQRAYDIWPSYKILYNLGLVHTQLNDFAGALRSFKKYLEDGGKKIDAKRRGEVEKEIAKLEKRVATVALEVNVDGADISVDDLDVGESPLDKPLVLNAGKRKIGVTKSGYQPFIKVLVLAGADTKTLVVKLKTPSAAAPAGKTGGRGKPDHEKPEGPKSHVPWVWWGITVGLAAGAVVTGVLALSAQEDLDDKKSRPATKQSLDDAATKTRALAIVTDVLLVGTIAAGSYATYRTFFKKPKDPRADKTKKASLDVIAGPGGVALSGTF